MSVCAAKCPTETVNRQVFQLKTINIHGFITKLLLYNKSTVPLILHTMHIIGRNNTAIPAFDSQSVLRMVPGYCFDAEVDLKLLVKDTNDTLEWNLAIVLVAVPIGSEKTVVAEVFHLKISPITKRTPLVLKRLPESEPCPYVQNVYDCKFNKKAVSGLQESKILSILDDAKNMNSLTSAHYKNQLKLLNQIEDIHLRSEFRQYTIINPVINHRSKLYYTISIKQFSTRPSLLKEDVEVIVYIEGKKREQKFYGIVDRVDSATVLLLMNKGFQTDKVVKIRFVDDRTTFKLEYKALAMMDQNVIDCMMFPQPVAVTDRIEEYSSFNWFRQTITSNEEQMTAVRNIVNRTAFPAPYILLGPPGTGKTSTLVEAIAQIYKLCPHKNILATATSNFAANELTDRLLSFVPATKIFRFFSKTAFRQIDSIKPNVLRVSNFSGNTYEMPCYEDIYDNRVVVCTLTTAGRLVQANISTEHFSYIFIDECGSAKEISALIPIINIGTVQSTIKASVILSGDPRQLGPVIQYDSLNNTTHSMSMLERMAELDCYKPDPTTGQYNNLLITQLRNNYRSHQSLLQFANEAFYAGQLRAKALPKLTNWAIGWHFLPNRNFPMLFHPIRGETKTSEGSFSLYNPTEIDQVVFYVRELLNNGINNKAVQQQQIGVISPYARQVYEFKEVFAQLKWNDIEVGSTEQYQGREKDIIIISTVRSNCSHVGFLANTKRLNVTVTRARALMIIVGDMVTLERNKPWKQLIAYCKRNGSIVWKKAKPKALKLGTPANKHIIPRLPERSCNYDLEEITRTIKSMVLQTFENLQTNQTLKSDNPM
ncbi:putative helicase mov-10-B.1 isoform X2 [Wyeomyia smithii]|nr:putative helicase mov-10-B.1 isoform X2 [Wyeomyia smithii]XP_055536660.1 putative helicase mov-10-B.1 isoform X2 [Wyeomyia smithii]